MSMVNYNEICIINSFIIINYELLKCKISVSYILYNSFNCPQQRFNMLPQQIIKVLKY